MGKQNDRKPNSPSDFETTIYEVFEQGKTSYSIHWTWSYLIIFAGLGSCAALLYVSEIDVTRCIPHALLCLVGIVIMLVTGHKTRRTIDRPDLDSSRDTSNDKHNE